MHNFLGRSRRVTQLALKIRNQANAVVASHFSGIEHPAKNGEYVLADLIAPTADNFIDVGANVGNWSSRFISQMNAPRGLLVDANSRCIEALQKKFQDYRELTILHSALSDYCGETSFFEGDGDASAVSSFTPAREYPTAWFVKKPTAVSTLDREVKKLGWSRVSMLKIDAEGHDYFVLRGARNLFEQKQIDFVQFECNSAWAPVGVTIVAAVRFLADFGYRTFQLHANGLRAVDVETYGSCGSANWLAFHDGSPRLPLRIYS